MADVPSIAPKQDAYVQCEECGHPLERHSAAGCDWQCDGCSCVSSWTVREVEQQRRNAGLLARFTSWDF